MSSLKKKNRLIIDFSGGEVIEKFGSSPDVVIITNVDSEFDNIYSITDAYDSGIDLSSEFIESWMSLSEEHQFDCQASLSYVHRNVIRPLNKWVSAVDSILDEFDVGEIVFTKFCLNKKVFLYEAEGEVNKKLLYRSEYYISSIINGYINHKYPNIKVSYDAVTPKFKVIISYWSRSLSLVCYVFFMNVVRRFRGLKNRKFRNSHDASEVIVSSRSIVQSDFAVRMIKQSEYGKVRIVTSEQTSKLSVNEKFMSTQSVPFDASSSCGIFLSAATLLRILKSVFKLSTSPVRPAFLLGGKLEIDLQSILIDYLFRSYEFEVYSLSLKEGVKDNKSIKRVVSFDMFTPHAFYLVKNIGFDVCQIQTTLIQPTFECDFVAGSKFYFTDKIAYDGFLKVNSHLKDKIDIIDGLKYRQVSKIENINKDLKCGVVYFSQPIELDNELQVVSALNSYCSANEIPLSIKVHPRQNKDFFLDYDIIDSSVNFEDIAKKYALVVTRSSSIGMDCFAHGIPVIFARTILSIKNAQISFIPDNYLGDVESISEMIEVIEDFDDLVLSFSQYSIESRLDDNIVEMLL